jgi:hypothetical protein
MLLRAADQGESYDRISGSLVADPSVLISLPDGFEVPTQGDPWRNPSRRQRHGAEVAAPLTAGRLFKPAHSVGISA